MNGAFITRPLARFFDLTTSGPSKRFESAEHLFIGNHITLTMADGTGDRAANLELRLPNGLSLTYGRIVALAGDFFGLPDEPIAWDPEPPTRFHKAFGQLAEAASGKTEADAIAEIMQDEINAVMTARSKNETDFRKIYDHFEDKTIAYVLTTNSRYLALLASNFDHFGKDAVTAYRAGHQAALTAAVAARTDANPDAALRRAYAMNAFADHYLSDLFSGGHVRTPRRELMDVVDVSPDAPSFVGNLLASLRGLSLFISIDTISALVIAQISRCGASNWCARKMHVEDGYWGIAVRNAKGDSWRAYGDEQLFDRADADNEARVIAAVQASASEIWWTFHTGEVPANYSTLDLIPDLDALRDVGNRDSIAPLLVPRDPGKVWRRTDIRNTRDYDWTPEWELLTTAAFLEVTEKDRLAGAPFDPPLSIDANEVQFLNIDGKIGLVEFDPSARGMGSAERS